MPTHPHTQHTVAGVNLLATDCNPAVAVRSEEERGEIERAWAVLGDDRQREEYDCRRGRHTTHYGRTSLGYEPETGIPRRPARPRTHASGSDSLGSGEKGDGRSRGNSLGGTLVGDSERRFGDLDKHGRGEEKFERWKRRRGLSEAEFEILKKQAGEETAEYPKKHGRASEAGLASNRQKENRPFC